MAWLFTLALFWAVGSLIARGIDRSNEYSRQQKAAHHGKIQSIKSNIYAIAWSECETIQREFRDMCPRLPPNETHLSYYAKRYGHSMQQEAIIRALTDLRNRGQDVLRAGGGYGAEPTIIPSYSKYDPREEAEGVRGLLTPIYGPFNMAQAAKATDERAISITKPIWNKERIGTNIVKWDDTTKDYW